MWSALNKRDSKPTLGDDGDQNDSDGGELCDSDAGFDGDGGELSASDAGGNGFDGDGGDGFGG